jgi:SAM-dependent methyltransferase
MSKFTWEQAVQWLRDKPDQLDLVRACYYDDPLPAVAERFWQSLEWKSIAALLPPAQGGLALDLGAGRGISSYALAKDGWKVSALEPDPSTLVGAGAIRALAHDSGLPIEVVTEFSEKLPFANNSFELVHCRQVLHHARDLPQTCREIFRVLRPGGRMVATREHVISKREDLQAFLDSHPLHHLYSGENAFLLSEYTGAITSAGLRIEKLLAPFDSPINYYPQTEEQWVNIYTAPIAKVFGRNLTKMLFNRKSGLGHLLVPSLAKLANWHTQAPGRLYSFVALKPKRL